MLLRAFRYSIIVTVCATGMVHDVVFVAEIVERAVSVFVQLKKEMVLRAFLLLHFHTN